MGWPPQTVLTDRNLSLIAITSTCWISMRGEQEEHHSTTALQTRLPMMSDSIWFTTPEQGCTEGSSFAQLASGLCTPALSGFLAMACLRPLFVTTACEGGLNPSVPQSYQPAWDRAAPWDRLSWQS